MAKGVDKTTFSLEVRELEVEGMEEKKKTERDFRTGDPPCDGNGMSPIYLQRYIVQRLAELIQKVNRLYYIA